jgi:hypothetical protein
MAEFDPPGGGSSEWTDTGSNVVPSGGETIGDSTDDADLQSVSAEYIERTGTPTGTDRPLWTTESTTVTVDAAGGADYTSIQDALNNIPLFILHSYAINVRDGDYTSEGTLIVPPHVLSYIDRDTNDESVNITIYGDVTTPTNVKTGAWIVDHSIGYRTKISGFNITEPDTVTDENSAISFYGCGKSSADAITVTGGTFGNAFLAYASDARFTGITIDGTATVNNGFVTKAMGQILINQGASISGSNVDSYLFRSIAGGGYINVSDTSNISITGSGGFADAAGTWINVPEGVTFSSDNRRVMVDGASSDATTQDFKGWTQLDADRFGLVTVDALAETDGTSIGNIKVEIDKSGGSGPADDSYTHVSQTPTNAGDSTQITASYPVPPGAQYQIVNNSDPNGGNVVSDVTETIF